MFIKQTQTTTNTYKTTAHHKPNKQAQNQHTQAHTKKQNKTRNNTPVLLRGPQKSLFLFGPKVRVLRSGSSPIGSGSKLCAKPRYFCVRSSYGDPVRGQNHDFRPSKKKVLKYEYCKQNWDTHKHTQPNKTKEETTHADTHTHNQKYNNTHTHDKTHNNKHNNNKHDNNKRKTHKHTHNLVPSII